MLGVFHRAIFNFVMSAISNTLHDYFHHFPLPPPRHFISGITWGTSVVGEAVIESHLQQDSNGDNFSIGVGPIATNLLKSNFNYSDAFKKAMVEMNVSGMAVGKWRGRSRCEFH